MAKWRIEREEKTFKDKARKTIYLGTATLSMSAGASRFGLSCLVDAKTRLGINAHLRASLYLGLVPLSCSCSATA